VALESEEEKEMMNVAKPVFERLFCVVFAALALVLLTTGTLTATPTANLDLVNAGSGANLGGVYTSPYYGTINGGSLVPVICDDFADESYVGETWTGYVTSLSSLASVSSATSGSTDTQLKWVNGVSAPLSISVDGSTLYQAQAYDVAALLSIDILASATGSQAQEDLSYALWGLFDPAEAFGAIGGLDLSNANNDLSAAVADVASNSVNGVNLGAYLSDYNVTIYTYDPSALANPNGPMCGSAPCPMSPPQEFIAVSMAEPPAPALLGIDLLGLAGLLMIARRQKWLAR
jgi:hypothetical protein